MSDAPLPLRPGERVTLVLPDHVVMVTVHASSLENFNCKLSTRGGKTIDSTWNLSEEGIGWIRGYYLADSPQVEACRTAQALAPSKPAFPALPMPPPPTTAQQGVLKPLPQITGSLPHTGITYGGGGSASQAAIDELKKAVEDLQKRQEEEFE